MLFGHLYCLRDLNKTKNKRTTLLSLNMLFVSFFEHVDCLVDQYIICVYSMAIIWLQVSYAHNFSRMFESNNFGNGRHLQK